jgi:hypothetical protein
MAEKRIRRTFTNIILDRIDGKAEGVDQVKYMAIRNKIEAALKEFDELLKAKPTLTAAKIKRLDRFTKEELELYLKTK